MEMASPGNQQCADCIGTPFVLYLEKVVKGRTNVER